MPSRIRVCWTEQWHGINPHVEPVFFHPDEAAPLWIRVHQLGLDLAGAVLADGALGHRYIFAHGLIQAMEVGPLPPQPTTGPMANVV